jgi:hypothetical protein
MNSKGFVVSRAFPAFSRLRDVLVYLGWVSGVETIDFFFFLFCFVLWYWGLNLGLHLEPFHQPFF